MSTILPLLPQRKRPAADFEGKTCDISASPFQNALCGVIAPFTAPFLCDIVVEDLDWTGVETVYGDQAEAVYGGFDFCGPHRVSEDATSFDRSERLGPAGRAGSGGRERRHLRDEYIEHIGKRDHYSHHAQHARNRHRRHDHLCAFYQQRHYK